MLVVSDASPLNILIRCGDAGVLPVVFGSVLIPPAVRHELTAARTPPDVKEFVADPPSWLVVRAPTRQLVGETKGLGEREAVALALELKADTLLVDDLRARRDAANLGIAVTGTLGVLERASARGLLVLEPAIERARGVGLIVADELVQAALRRDRARRERS